ncbi:MAG: MtnX-like HAD-IB family phosphatase [Gemmataceae bacterium]
MGDLESSRSLQPLFVTDFDGTVTQHDFFKLAVEHLLPAETPDFWAEYRSKQITHFEAMRKYYAAIRKSEEDVLKIIEQMHPDPLLAEGVSELRQCGWEVVIVSNGCDWYINKILASFGVEIEVLTSPSRFVEGQGLLMDLPKDSPFFWAEVGIDKAAVVQHGLEKERVVAFAGNGYPDLPAARLVAPDLRFAREDLADALEREGLPFQRFSRWLEVAKSLTQRGAV